MTVDVVNLAPLWEAAVIAASVAAGVVLLALTIRRQP